MDGTEQVPAEVQRRRERLRRWGWVVVALGLVGPAVLVEWSLSTWGDVDLDTALIGAVLAIPVLFGARMVVSGHSASPARVRFHLGPLLTLAALIGGFFYLAIPTCACTTRARAYGAAMKSDLKNLASQQEIYFSDNQTYSVSQRDLGFVNSDGVRVDIVASPSGWAARAWHEAVGPHLGCALYWGEAPSLLSTGSGRTPSEPGVLDCDEIELE